MLPKNEKVNRSAGEGIKMFLYGAPLTGKTTFASKFPDVLMINTDGNIKYVDSPAVSPKNWLEFKSIVDDIVEGKHTFKTIVVDLIEDVYTMCRIHYFKELKITHESDLGYGKGYDIIRTDFLSNLSRLCSTQYNVILISHENEKSVKNRVGIEKTHYMPNIADKIANKISGLVEITSRLLLEFNEETGEDDRVLRLSPNSDEFGGFRPPSIKVEKTNAEYSELIKILG